MSKIYISPSNQNNNSYSYQMKMGDGAIIKGDIDSAEKYYLQALSLSANDIRVRLDLADIYMEKSENEKALVYLLQVVQNKITSENQGRIIAAYKKLIEIYEADNNLEAILDLKKR